MQKGHTHLLRWLCQVAVHNMVLRKETVISQCLEKAVHTHTHTHTHTHDSHDADIHM